MRRYLFLAGFVLLHVTGCLFAQQSPLRFAKDVNTIKEFDKMYAPPEHPILFVGSSSIRKWDDLERNFSSYVVLNRGVGGAITTDITYFANDIIFPYHPRQIVIYVGENDLVEDKATADTLLQRFKVLYTTIRSKLPEVPLVYISMKPSPSRAKFFEKAKQSNALIRDYISKEKNIVYVDIFPLMLDKTGKSREELFLDDMLHMNKKGYAIWEKAIQPHLLKK
ncbi:GDSL-type esterase/lipase family protein [Chitinophaga ginsengisegetis]|uniref:GDSL-type esterase/lipase family protein n=1 Tax=Chitinophaga ginsengisegetis TaxID=393003 RepID=UPI000DBA2148|nr:GDSL-type esterase/lipase family protein [Chitinophaga ginsengisegetis]MDR6568922.1 lysophospholipase L1-like esterase [Chitinophaga ginsengisegetis]MDR6649049.1 lysophospholipase L1-like esterase [Chitinophaga ginsengisegetis]MDR6655003.1 lysophospholipase L1-like esterase [Chitinophaga ginsengisegetis]